MCVFVCALWSQTLVTRGFVLSRWCFKSVYWSFHISKRPHTCKTRTGNYEIDPLTGKVSGQGGRIAGIPRHFCRCVAWHGSWLWNVSDYWILDSNYLPQLSSGANLAISGRRSETVQNQPVAISRFSTTGRAPNVYNIGSGVVWWRSNVPSAGKSKPAIAKIGRASCRERV